MLEAKNINGLIRVVYRRNNQLATDIIFDSYADAWAYIDKVCENFLTEQIA